ncbi:MAG: ABC transporter ATP-binding protein [Chloroflexi bacterium]|nr:ABC transporter ATP-binding protein [Chloroflexota bacterium]MQC26653.1 ABC transporter ATP-binding protein [Chloroflexota bacterium]
MTQTTAANTTSQLLDVIGLKTYFFTDDGVLTAVDGVDFSVARGEVFGLVGESGCGKSVTSLSVMRLVDAPGKIVEGEIKLEGENLLTKTAKEMTSIRGQQISMVFQQPKSSLNPVFTIGDQIMEVFEIHEDIDEAEAWERTIELLHTVGIPEPESKANAYPHELSGGQAQRVMIAMALALKPKLLIADEPTTALDVTIQAQILDLIRELSAQTGTAVILITHDLGVVAEMADRVAVMYAGQIVEEADTISLFQKPLHPYTQGLHASVPVLGQTKERLETIPGNVPNLIGQINHCRFAPRCKARVDYELDICNHQEPDLIDAGEGRKVRCWLYQSSGEHKAPLKIN